MTPKELLEFMYSYDFSLLDFVNDIEWKLNESGDVDDTGRESFKEIGEYELVEEFHKVTDEKRSSESVIINFKTLGFCLEERIYKVWGEETGRDVFTVEPIGHKVIYGNHQKISE